VSSAIRDITDEKGEDKFRDLLESAPDAMVIVNKDGRIQLINAQTEKLFVYSRQELVGSGWNCVPERFRRAHPGTRTGYLRPASAAMGSGLELFGLRKDGPSFDRNQSQPAANRRRHARVERDSRHHGA